MGFFIDEESSSPDLTTKTQSSVPQGFFVDEGTPTDYSTPSYADAFSFGLDRNTAIGAAKGIGRGALDIFTAPADLLTRGGNAVINALTGTDVSSKGMLPSDYVKKAYDWFSGGEGSQTAEDVAKTLTEVGITLALPTSAASKLPLYLKAPAVGAEAAGYSVLANSAEEDPFKDVTTSAAIGTSLPLVARALSSGGGKVMDFLRPERTSTKLAQEFTDELRSIAPSFGMNAISPAQRASNIGLALDAQGNLAKQEASALFQALGDDPVILDDAIKNISQFADDVAGPIAPGSRTESLISSLARLKPQDEIINIPASTILDEFGKPMREAFTEVIPGGPAKIPLNKLQDALRDVGKLQRGATGVDRAVLGRAQEELLNAADTAGTLPQLQEARAAWRNMKQTFDEGGIEKIRDAVTDVEGRYETVKNVLLNDSKSAEKIAKLLNPAELEDVQNLMLREVLKMSPASWEGKLGDKYDSFKAVFGKESTDKLLNAFSREGTIGRKLLQDNNGLRTVLGRFIAKPLIGATVGYELGGKEGAALGVLGSLRAGNSQKALNNAKSLIMKASLGSDDAIKILNTPAKGGNYDKAIGKLSNIIPILLGHSQPSIEEAPSNTKIENVSSVNTNPNTFVDETVNKAEAMIEDKTPKAPPVPEIISAERIAATEPLVEAVIGQESGGRADAVSNKGAIGLMQVMPATARDIADELGRNGPPEVQAMLEQSVKDFMKEGYSEEEAKNKTALKMIKDPTTNRLFGTYYLNKLIDKFGDVKLALAAYNGGMGRVERLLKKTKGSTFEDIEDYLPSETRKYVPGVLKRIKV